MNIRFRSYIAAFSMALSYLVIGLVALSVYVTDLLDGRARWSGEAAPQAWIKSAGSGDIFAMGARDIVYWGDPKAKYSRYATRSKRTPVAIVVHHTAVKPVQNLVNYGHISDPNRGGASFGYHFYIGRDGNIVQGAPLSRRTNHIKFKTNKMRREMARHLWSGNTIAITLVGACDPLMRPRWRDWGECSDEFVSKAQLEAGLAVIRALQFQFSMKCDEVYGHGDLQFDRESFEGLRLSRLARAGCAAENVGPEVVVRESVASPKPKTGTREAAVGKQTSNGS
jgi:phage terminase large subunit-like protein